jgi:hypothetical protein
VEPAVANMASLPFKVKASYEYSSPHDDDLSFPQGQIITVTEEEDADWYVGEYSDESGALKSGLFPRNFVQRYEPAPPPRPVRSSRKQTSQPPPEQAVDQPEHHPQDEVPAQQQAPPPAPSNVSIASPAQLSSPVDATAPQLPVAQPAPKPAAAKAPPPVAEKPASFKDRIAAFNKASGPPVTPFKPGALASGGFVKKPFIAPPPSRSAYVPLPPDSTRKVIYKREEDPEIVERQAQDREIAEKAGLVPTSAEGEEEAPKAVSLKERIALLQKQQLEQASRRADMSAKEKPRKPPPKRSESEGQDATDEREPQDLGIRVSSELDREQDRPRRTPRIPQVADVQASDGNDADQSAADETAAEAEGASTGEEEEPHAAAPADAEEEEEEEDEMDEEARHQLALRERMAKLSGGMGMTGMFGLPGAMPMPGMRSNSIKKKAPERSTVDEDDTASPPPPPRVPIPGLNRTPSHPPDDVEDPRFPKGNGISVSPFRRWAASRSTTRQYSSYNESLPCPAPRPYESKDYAIRWILCSLH